MLIDRQRRRRLFGVFDGRGFAFFIQLLGGLRVLKVLIGRGRSGLLRRILLGRILLDTLLRLCLGANSKDCTLRCSSGNRWRLALVDRRQVGVGRVRAKIVGGRRAF